MPSEKLFVSALLYLDCYYNEYHVKQTASLYSFLAFETCAFLLVSLVLFSWFILNRFISNYLDQTFP